jgi:SAM-dependent methyltransferase
MVPDTPEFWNEVWAMPDEGGSGSDDVLVAEVGGMTPGRALEMGCGTGANAVWLAEHGWQVTAVDFSEVAIARGRRLAKERGVDVRYVVADASAYEPEGQHDLILSFYIELWPEQRRQMLARSANALAPGGVLLFIGHNKDDAPSGWSQEDLQALTSPEMVTEDLPWLRIEKALVHKSDAGPAHTHGSDGQDHTSGGSSSTLVRAVRVAASLQR